MPLKDKPTVIEHLFKARYDEATKTFSDEVVDADALKAAMEYCNQNLGTGLSTNNPANFLKDYLRSPRRNADWPPLLHSHRVTARQKYRNKRVFAFAPYETGVNEPFPDEFVIATEEEPHTIEAVSLPSDARALGRKDEAWLIQVCVHQRILQTHFALYSKLKVVDIFHLQNSLKATPEIDAVFLMTLQDGGKRVKALVTMEAKREDPILKDQVRSQVAYMASQCQKKAELNDIKFIIPVAARSGRRGTERVVNVFEMSKIAVDVGAASFDAEEEHLIALKTESSVSYRFKPTIIGI
ncbi:hypothetical protein [Bosea sp. NBC_00550]|uniref:hypothetical protein n=1 Tax=Bosea sp. NBC_00550 TaxID=2969621 RepID=UPI00222E8311|nr:hypothetical protein [Bosea sp. NBC_00550]UZF93723.1 hypothetical protein NWE53_05885 [Bosea sp. NBC_00550]